MSSDRHAHWDAAYVLGALSAAERQEYEDHLTSCPSCRDAVAELAGMPGLLARVPTGEVLAMGELEGALAAQPPPSLMPVLPPEHRRWGQHVLVPAVAAAALVVGGLGGYALSEGRGATDGPPAATSTAGPVRVAFSPVSESSMTAVLDVVPQGAGTCLRVECQYALKMPDGSVAEGARRSTPSGSSTARAGQCCRRPGPPSRTVSCGPPRPRHWRPTTLRPWRSGGSTRARRSFAPASGDACGPPWGSGSSLPQMRCYSFVRISGLWRSW